ncbi:DUF2780 domain-containing protein [Stutzerimonas azotifigens]|uniref:DUF2780 domain-containing protein n=1 Tax=Stutzerimonas azotifigens TaxID=291995 RepID=UPI000401AED1|nr:DUF2780 domain-containing protein [Stutzerimonas azotifigens]
MKFLRPIVITAVAALAAGPALAFDLNEAARLGSMMAGSGAQGQTAQALNLVRTLDDLGVTPQQALGGTGALLNVARNQLPASQYDALLGEVPGLKRFAGSDALGQLAGLGGLLGQSGGGASVNGATRTALDNVQTLPQAQQAFSMLGMDPGLIGQFAPLLLQYLGGQGVGGSLLQSLGSIWGVGEAAQ